MSVGEATPSLLLECHEGGIALVRINRPGAMNAMDAAMVANFHEMLAQIDSDETIHVVVLTGTEHAFCAGLDLRSLDMTPGGSHHGAVAWMNLQEAYAGMSLRLHDLRQPVVAAICGPAIGVGCALALACDVRVAGQSADLRVGAVKIGLSAGESGISYHLPRLIGAARAFEIMLTGRRVDAQEALAIGLVSRVVEDDEALNAALEVAREIAANSPYSIKHSKQVMWANLDAPSLAAAVELENHVQVIGLLTEDFREAIDAFTQKRAPRFSGA
jgi:enoyl-CoA hydratase